MVCHLRSGPKTTRDVNQVCFASQTPGGFAQLSEGWTKLGIRLERIVPGKPQQNGRQERLHWTLFQDQLHGRSGGKWVAQPFPPARPPWSVAPPATPKPSPSASTVQLNPCLGWSAMEDFLKGEPGGKARVRDDSAGPNMPWQQVCPSSRVIPTGLASRICGRSQDGSKGGQASRHPCR